MSSSRLCLTLFGEAGWDRGAFSPLLGSGCFACPSLGQGGPGGQEDGQGVKVGLEESLFFPIFLCLHHFSLAGVSPGLVQGTLFVHRRVPATLVGSEGLGLAHVTWSHDTFEDVGQSHSVCSYFGGAAPVGLRAATVGAGQAGAEAQMGQAGGSWPSSLPLMKLSAGVSALPQQTLGPLSAGCWWGGLGFGFAAQTKEIWGHQVTRMRVASSAPKGRFLFWWWLNRALKSSPGRKSISCLLAAVACSRSWPDSAGWLGQEEGSVV